MTHRDQLPAGMANRRGEGTSPRVLPDKHGSRATGLQISGDLLDVVQGQHKGQIGLEGPVGSPGTELEFAL